MFQLLYMLNTSCTLTLRGFTLTDIYIEILIKQSRIFSSYMYI